MTDSGKQTRVLCIVNKESRVKTLYPGDNVDSECTFLQQFCKKVKWQLQLHKNKTSEVRMSMAMVFNATFLFSVHAYYTVLFCLGRFMGSAPKYMFPGTLIHKFKLFRVNNSFFNQENIFSSQSLKIITCITSSDDVCFLNTSL